MFKKLGLLTSNLIRLYICSEKCNLMKVNSGCVVTCIYKCYKLVLVTYVYW